MIITIPWFRDLETQCACGLVVSDLACTTLDIELHALVTSLGEAL